jgi:hypothetical protein
VSRVKSTQESLYENIKKEEDKKQKAIDEARMAEQKNISIAEEKKQRKLAEAAAKNKEDDYDMPKDVDEELKDLYSDSTTSKRSSKQMTYEEAAENAESGKQVEAKKEAPAAEKKNSFAKLPDFADTVLPSAPVVQAQAAPAEVKQEAPKAAEPVADVNPLSFSVLTENLSKK